jgi:hypothetical protein
LASNVLKIVSGGQTGADRAGLDAAIELGLAHGGWCPHGRRTEDGPLPEHYQLQETESSSYTQRTVFNVRDSDATVVFTLGVLGPGSKNTLATAKKLGKPRLYVDLSVLPEARDVADLTGLMDVGIPVLVTGATLFERLNPAATPERRRIDAFQHWLASYKVQILNVAGSRESSSPGIGQAVRQLLLQALR